MKPAHEYGDAVRLKRTVRDDGTFPGKKVGDVLVRRGSVGYVHDVGTFLQDQLIYSIDFFEDGIMVGCREQEIQPVDEPWVDVRFEFRDKVITRVNLRADEEIVAPIGTQGEILKVIPDRHEQVMYHVRFPGRTFQVPESALDLAERRDENAEEMEVVS